MQYPDKYTLIQQLQLESHQEGGYFRRTFASGFNQSVEWSEGTRPAASSIYYLLTDEQPTGHWHRNRSDIMHYFQLGAPLHYHVVSPAGEYQHVVLGPDLANGHQLQLLVPGGYWKASHLPRGEYGLISEAVVPGFVVEDMDFATADDIAELVGPVEFKALSAFVRGL
ncbi:Uncharacterised protein [BD1-7 clade bacterium]|uniref:DUF985 domain-containing protein n=1 Tax=BD1-7 clade bacterium TaxID=2029982 RepID=A0A5S9PJ06_9GAMM|nr:Uncharacterised protein [BD1-7 clade bacterium]CAA0104039.1 Uncharacterised protein [BD1-7 clade bacterium]